MADVWQPATVLDIRDETARAKTFRLALPRPTGHRAGQHYVVRLTAPDGYTAQRSYSVASAPDGSNEFELTVERLAGGEVSPFLHDVVVPGDELEVRGPIGGWFVWDASSPALLIGGGSGVVPLMAMLRLARARDREDLLQVVVSVRSPADLYYGDEIVGQHTTLAFTGSAPDGFGRPVGRLSPDDIGPLVRDEATAYVCGSHLFADAMADLLQEIGVEASRIRLERFGPTG